MLTQRLWISIAGMALVLAAASLPARAADDGDATACVAAGRAAERAMSLPDGLLLAIGRVESGRRDPVSQRTAAWPWTINANGSGAFFATQAEAVAATQDRQAHGIASIDVGCFQINLLSHPAAFANLDAAFDPPTNAAYAARFLAALHDRTGSWEAAVAAYHSATAERGAGYRDTVLANWLGHGNDHAGGVTVAVWTQPETTVRMRVWTPSAYGSAPAMISTDIATGDVPMQQTPHPSAIRVVVP